MIAVYSLFSTSKPLSGQRKTQLSRFCAQKKTARRNHKRPKKCGSYRFNSILKTKKTNTETRYNIEP